LTFGTDLFSVRVVGKDGKARIFRLFQIGLVPIRRHVKIKSEANPYDSAYGSYFSKSAQRKIKNSAIFSSEMNNFAKRKA